MATYQGVMSLIKSLVYQLEAETIPLLKQPRIRRCPHIPRVYLSIAIPF